MKVSRWGNSLALRLPKAIVEALELAEGDSVELHIVGTASFGVAKAKTSKELFARLRRFRGRLPADFIFAREEAHER